MPPDVVLNGVALDALLRGPEGPVARTILAVANDTRELARSKVRPGSVGAGENYGRRGHLRDSYVVRMMEGAEALVGSPLKQAEFVEKGTQPHDIVPRTARVLRFYSVKIAGALGKPLGSPLFFKRVHHPGTKPQHILTRSLVEAIARRTHIP